MEELDEGFLHPSIKHISAGNRTPAACFYKSQCTVTKKSTDRAPVKDVIIIILKSDLDIKHYEFSFISPSVENKTIQYSWGRGGAGGGGGGSDWNWDDPHLFFSLNLLFSLQFLCFLLYFSLLLLHLQHINRVWWTVYVWTVTKQGPQIRFQFILGRCIRIRVKVN